MGVLPEFATGCVAGCCWSHENGTVLPFNHAEVGFFRRRAFLSPVGELYITHDKQEEAGGGAGDVRGDGVGLASRQIRNKKTVKNSHDT